MKTPLLLFIITILFTFTKCNVQADQQENKISTLDPEAYEIKLKETQAPQLLDVRTPSEYEEGHLTDARLINYYDPSFKEQLSNLNKNAPVFLYCASGGRSGEAAKILAEEGFTDVVDLKGGIKAWKQSGKTIVK